jgi:bla regulator protein BlaR1
MNWKFEGTQGPLTAALGWTLLHSLWQAALVALLLAVVLRATGSKAAQARYCCACAAMILVATMFISTFLLFAWAPIASWSALQSGHNAAIDLANGPFTKLIRLPEFFPALTRIWLLGVSMFLIRLLVGWRWTSRIRRCDTAPMSPVWQERFQGLRMRMKAQHVLLIESGRIRVPAVVGFRHPAIIVPRGMPSAMESRQVEVLLAHELAHVRRRDYVFNFIQSAISVPFFYNPFVWWLSSQIRQERENCCDDVAISICGDALLYARALTTLEEHLSPTSQLAAAANGGLLVKRVKRILIPQTAASGLSRNLAAVVGIALMVCLAQASLAMGSTAASLLAISLQFERPPASSAVASAGRRSQLPFGSQNPQDEKSDVVGTSRGRTFSPADEHATDSVRPRHPGQPSMRGRGEQSFARHPSRTSQMRARGDRP